MSSIPSYLLRQLQTHSADLPIRMQFKSEKEDGSAGSSWTSTTRISQTVADKLNSDIITFTTELCFPPTRPHETPLGPAKRHP
jgi:hypothetical protein